MARCWIGVAAADHVARGVREGVCAFSHGSAAAAARLARGDRFAWYAPRTAVGAGEAVQAFVALGTVTDEAPERRDSDGFSAAARRADYAPVTPAPVRPLLDRLSFVSDKRAWGMAFRRGLFPVPAEDFAVIAAALTGDRA